MADEFNAAFDLIDYVFTVVTNGLVASLNIAWNVLNGVWSWIENAFSTVYGWITSAVTWWWENIILPAIGLIRDGLNYAVEALQFAINLAQSALDWVINNLIIPLFQWVESAAVTVAHWIWDALDTFYRDVIAPILHDIETIFADVVSLANFVWHTVLDVVNAVIKAWDWVVWFGEHTFSDILHLLEGTDSGLTRDWLLGAAHDPHGWHGRIVDDLARILE